ncbi:hypothetical protein LB504_010946 [Fusarium proliferatum]|nr:hypothetical protein LB504_010946 [Fusarium proliferatum]
MSLKRRGSELDHEAKKMKSDDSHGDDEVSPSSGVQTTPTLPHQPVAVFADLSQTAREQVNYLLQALSDVSPETLYEVNILDQINAINSDGHRSPPRFTYKPPDMEITIGYVKHTHDCNEKGCDRIMAAVNAVPYAVGYFTVEVGNPKRHPDEKLVLPCPVTFKNKGLEGGLRP